MRHTINDHIAAAAAFDAGHDRMERNYRKRWSKRDDEQATRTFQRLYPRERHLEDLKKETPA